jgi:hypothetical protein
MAPLLGTSDSIGAAVAYLRLLGAGYCALDAGKRHTRVTPNRVTGGHHVHWPLPNLDMLSDFFKTLTYSSPREPYSILEAIEGHGLDVEIAVITPGPSLSITNSSTNPYIRMPFTKYSEDHKWLSVTRYMNDLEKIDGITKYLERNSQGSVSSKCRSFLHWGIPPADKLGRDKLSRFMQPVLAAPFDDEDKA